MDIVHIDELQHLIDEGILKSYDDLVQMQDDASKYLSHKCNQRCLVRVSPHDGPDAFCCCKPNNVKISPENMKHCIKQFPINLTQECIQPLIQTGLAECTSMNKTVSEQKIVLHHPFFTPSRHIPPTNPTNDLNISPVDGYHFAASRSMQNVHSLTHTNGAYKYVCKYIGKIDQQNYVVVSTMSHKNGTLTTQSNFLHNTKIAISAINENKAINNRRDSKHPRGRVISLNEMVHHMLGYKEVHTNMVFVSIPTCPIEIRPGVEKLNTKLNTDMSETDNPSDEASAISDAEEVRAAYGFPAWRRHRPQEILILQSGFQPSVSIDKISLFSVRPPELKYVVDKVGNYFRCFHIEPKVMKISDIYGAVDIELSKSQWVDGIGHYVYLCVGAIAEFGDYLKSEAFDYLQDESLRDSPISTHGRFYYTYCLFSMMQRKKMN